MKYRRDFTLFPRRLRGAVVWYYRTYDADGRRQAARSTGQTSKTLAEKYCNKLLKEGRLAAPIRKELTLSEWAAARNWWRWGECAYLQAQLARSQADRPKVSEHYADESLRALERYILPAHGRLRLSQITPRALEDLLFAWRDEGASHKTVNNRASVYRIMLKEAARLGEIEANPWDRVRGLVPTPKQRGSLTLDEARKLLDPRTVDEVWEGHHLYYAINLTAALTAMRQGEVLALRREDVFPNHFHVEGSWSIVYGRGRTKTKRVDDIPIPGFLYQVLQPYLLWPGYVFSYSQGARPCTGNRVTEWLYKALERIGITQAQREARNIVFHSWRKFVNTYLLGRGIARDKVRAITRHETDEMTTLYTGFQAQDFADVTKAQEELAGSLGDS